MTELNLTELHVLATLCGTYECVVKTIGHPKTKPEDKTALQNCIKLRKKLEKMYKERVQVIV